MPPTARIKLIAVGFLTACIAQAALVFAIGGIVFNNQKPVVEIFLLLLKSIPGLLINGFLYGLLLALAAAVPATIMIWLAERFALRSLVYYLVVALALILLSFGVDLLRWPMDQWLRVGPGRNAGAQLAAAAFAGLVYWAIAGRSAGSADGLETNRFNSHLVTILLAFMVACIAVATVWGIRSATAPSHPNMPSNMFSVGALYGIYFTSLFGSLLLLPVIAAESFRIRSAIFYGLAGAVILLLEVIASYWFFNRQDALEFSRITFAVVTGVGFGLTYWAIAGRHAGQWRGQQVQ